MKQEIITYNVVVIRKSLPLESIGFLAWIPQGTPYLCFDSLVNFILNIMLTFVHSSFGLLTLE
jgi:hypothetical protein